MLFDDGINTDIEAYILGFIYADGHTKANGRALEINLGIKDVDFLQQLCDIFNKDLDKNYHVRIADGVHNNKICRLSINSTRLVRNLNKLYIHHRKVDDRCDTIFTSIPDIYKSAFLRGYFDGDGCITFNKTYPHASFFSSNIVLLKTVAKYCSDNGICTNSYVHTRQNGVSQFTIYGYNNVIKFREFIYKNMEICLPRKYIKLYTVLPLTPQASKYKYITYDKKLNRWQLRITIEGKRKYFGRYKTEIEALNKYNELAIIYNLSIQ